jgi:hypothetical protein
MAGRKGCSPHMRKNEDPQRATTFRDRNQGLVKGLGKIAISPDHSISNVFLIDSLDYNLLLFISYAKWATTVYLLIYVLLSIEEVMIQ